MGSRTPGLFLFPPMKLKQQPEDFQVEEVTALTAGDSGAYALYRLEKRGWSTVDALALLRRRWEVQPQRLSYGGLKDRPPRGHARSLVDYLRVHPGDFRGAVARLRPELRGLYLSAYQSHLWNRMLAHWLRRHCRPEQLEPMSLRLGDVPVPRDLDPE